MAGAFCGAYVQESTRNTTQIFVKIRNTLFALGIGTTSLIASAVSLGSASGSVVLGSPVDLTFQVQPDPGSDAASSCVSANVMAGDTVISGQKVRITPVGATSVRLRASISVDEPVLRVTLSAGCVGAVTRSYTFLVDLPVAARQAPSVMPLDIARLAGPASAASGGSSDLPTSAMAQANAAKQPGTAARTPAARAQSNVDAPRVPSSVRKPAVREQARVTAPVLAKPRLLVESLDTWLDLAIALRSTEQLLSAPSQDDSPQRAQAQALWRALNAQPESQQQEIERLKTLEAGSVTAKASAARDRAEIDQLRQRLELAEQAQFSSTLVYALGGLLLLALLLAAWMWSRLRSVSKQAEKAWHDSIAFGAKLAPRTGEGADLGADTVSGLNDAGLTLIPPDSYPLPDAAPPLAEKSLPRAPVQPAKAVAAAAPRPTDSHRAQPQFVRSVFAASQSPLQIVNPEDLLDIQQQA